MDAELVAKELRLSSEDRFNGTILQLPIGALETRSLVPAGNKFMKQAKTYPSLQDHL